MTRCTVPEFFGLIVLWIPNRTPLNLNKLGMTSLLNDSMKKIAIANPAHAPYGRAAAAAMEYAKLYDRVKGKLVLGENISQAAQFLQSGAADAGIIALSLAVSGPMQKAGRYWLIPSETYPRLEQGAELLKRAGSAGRAFHEWLRGPGARRIFEKHGFGQ